MENKKTTSQAIRRMYLGYRKTQYIIANAYLAAAEKGYLDFRANSELINFCNETNASLQKSDLKTIKDIVTPLEKEELKELVLDVLFSESFETRDFTEPSSNSLLTLVDKILDIDGGGHIVADFGSGQGKALARFLVESQRKGYILKDLIGYEINLEHVNVSRMALEILSVKEPRPFIVNRDVLDLDACFFTRGYCFPPMGMKYCFKEKARKSKLFKNIEFTSRNTFEWVFVDNMLSHMHEFGKAVAVVSGRSLFNQADEKYRKALVQSGLLEAIIELPSGSLNFSATKPYLLVFSHNNKYVKIINASDASDAETNRINKLEINTEKVYSLYKSNATPTRKIEELSEITNLTPSSILLDVYKPKNGVCLNELAEVFTGNQYTLSVFEKNGMLCEKPTGYKILTSSDIEDGLVEWKSLRYIDYKDNKFDKYAIKKDDIVLTSKSSKVKTVVVDIEPEEKILVTGGMIVIRPNVTRLNPTYLKTFLDSEQGQKTLKSIQKGSIVTTINSKDLATIMVPVPNIEKQNEIANKYNSKLTTLYSLKQEVRKLEDSIKNFFLDECEAE